MALGGDGFAVSTAAATSASERLREAGTEVAACLTDLPDRPHRTLLLLTDGLAGDQQDIVRGAYDVAGSTVPLVGGCAGDDLAMVGTHVERTASLLAELKALGVRIDDLGSESGDGVLARAMPDAIARVAAPAAVCS